VYLLIFHAHINEMHGSRSKIPSKQSRPYIYIYIYQVKFLALLGAPYTYDISRLKVNAGIKSLRATLPAETFLLGISFLKGSLRDVFISRSALKG
jgi:hypothetical protein